LLHSGFAQHLPECLAFLGSLCNIVLSLLFAIMFCVMMWLFWPSTQQMFQKLYQSTVLHWFYLVTATCFDPYLDHHGSILKYVTCY
jgi:hypothetical protein